MGDISKNFSRHEFACHCGCGYDTVDVELVEVLEDVRNHFDAPVTINSGSRCPHHNALEGGSSTSQHLWGKAADIVVSGVHEDKVVDYLEHWFPNTFGIGRYDGRTHIDVRSTKARWDNRT